MSIVFPTTAIVPIKSQLRTTSAGLFNKPAVSPRAVLAQFNWASEYNVGTANPNANVLVNVLGAPGGAEIAIDQIRSVKIDNLGNPFSVYVYFLDTTDTIVAPPNSTVWEPVVTNQPIANVIIQGATDQVGSTKVYFCNFIAPPYVDAEIANAVALWNASASITKGKTIQNTNLGIPALGDQTIGVFIGTTSVHSFNALPALLSGFYYITNIWFSFLGMDAAGTLAQVQLLNGGVGGTIIQRWQWFTGMLGTISPYYSGNCQLKLDATKTIDVATTIATGAQGQGYCQLVYSTNPN